MVTSPKSRPWWILWIWGCPWLVLAPKVFQLCTNHLVLVLCRFMWVVEACHFFLIPSRNSSTPLCPSKRLRVKERASTLYSFVVFNLDSHLSPSRRWERVNLTFLQSSFFIYFNDILWFFVSLPLLLTMHCHWMPCQLPHHL
jgi:hypothetical protein